MGSVPANKVIAYGQILNGSHQQSRSEPHVFPVSMDISDFVLTFID